MRLLLAVCALSVVAAVHARADWGYTRWGMSPEQVVSASGDKAKSVAPIDRGLGRILLQGEDVIEGMTFTSSFVFRERKLTAVELALDRCAQDQQAKIQALLMRRHGAPLMAVQEGAALARMWNDASSGEIIRYAAPSGTGRCDVSYRTSRWPLN